MLTIFGKKKKDDSGVQIDTGTDAGQTPSQTPSMPPDPMQTQAPNPITSQNQPTTWPKQSVMGQTTPPPPPPKHPKHPHLPAIDRTGNTSSNGKGYDYANSSACTSTASAKTKPAY